MDVHGVHAAWLADCLACILFRVTSGRAGPDQALDLGVGWITHADANTDALRGNRTYQVDAGLVCHSFLWKRSTPLPWTGSSATQQGRAALYQSGTNILRVLRIEQLLACPAHLMLVVEYYFNCYV